MHFSELGLGGQLSAASSSSAMFSRRAGHTGHFSELGLRGQLSAASSSSAMFSWRAGHTRHFSEYGLGGQLSAASSSSTMFSWRAGGHTGHFSELGFVEKVYQVTRFWTIVFLSIQFHVLSLLNNEKNLKLFGKFL